MQTRGKKRNSIDIEVIVDGDLNLLKGLVSRGYSLPKNAMKEASRGGYLNMVHFLYSMGLNHNTSAVDLACEEGHLDVVNFLYSAWDKKGPFCTEMAAIWSCKNGHLNIVRFLYPILGISIFKEVFPTGMSCIDIASKYGQLSVVKFLYSKGIYPSTEAIDWASQYGYLNVVRFLYDSGANYTSRAINSAVMENRIEVVKFLLSKGEIPGTNTLKWGKKKGSEEMKELLKRI